MRITVCDKHELNFQRNNNFQGNFIWLKVFPCTVTSHSLDLPLLRDKFVLTASIAWVKSRIYNLSKKGLKRLGYQFIASKSNE